MSIDPTRNPPSKKSGIARYLVPLVLLVAVIGGIAWVAQHLDNWRRERKSNPNHQPQAGRSPLEFARRVAQWGPKPVPGEEKFEAREYEPGQKGHYDFPFTNTSKEDVEIVQFASSCDCTSVQASALDEEQIKRVMEEHAETPSAPLNLSDKTPWRTLIKDADWSNLGTSAKSESAVLIKPGAGGVVRVQWTAGKTTGAPLNVSPKVRFRAVGSSATPFEVQLGVPLMVSAPVRFHPQRVTAGALAIGASTTAEIHAYSTTRDQFDLQLIPTASESLFEVQSTPLKVGGIFSRSQCPELLAALDTEKSKPHVRAAHRITITIHESRGGKYLDLGTYLRKFAVKLDGFPAPDVVEPEVVGRVHGEIIIGGSDDQGRVRIKDFSRDLGGSRLLELSTDAAWKLEPHQHYPAWVNVELTKAKEQPDPKRTIWRLRVEVPPNTRGVRSLEDPDAVVLRVTGPTERFVRIPIEGQMTGGR